MYSTLEIIGGIIFVLVVAVVGVALYRLDRRLAPDPDQADEAGSGQHKSGR